MTREAEDGGARSMTTGMERQIYAGNTISLRDIATVTNAEEPTVENVGGVQLDARGWHPCYHHVVEPEMSQGSCHRER